MVDGFTGTAPTFNNSSLTFSSMTADDDTMNSIGSPPRSAATTTTTNSGTNLIAHNNNGTAKNPTQQQNTVAPPPSHSSSATTTTFSLSSGVCMSGLLQLANELALSFSMDNKGGVFRYTFHANAAITPMLSATHRRSLAFVEELHSVLVFDRYDDAVLKEERWMKADWVQFLWAVSSAVMTYIHNTRNDYFLSYPSIFRREVNVFSIYEVMFVHERCYGSR